MAQKAAQAVASARRRCLVAACRGDNHACIVRTAAPMKPPAAARVDRAALRELRAFERLLSELSPGFVGLDVERIDGAIEDALDRIVQTLDIDHCSMVAVSRLTGLMQATHSWPRPGIEETPWLNVGETNPWALSVERSGRAVVLSRLTDAVRNNIKGRALKNPNLTLTMTRPAFLSMLLQRKKLPALVPAGMVKVEGNPQAVGAMVTNLVAFDPIFNIFAP